MIGGAAGFQSSEGYRSFVLNPNYGYFVANRIAVGAQLGVGLYGGDGASSSEFGLAPFVRYYITDGTPTKFFGTASVGYSTFKVEGFDGVSSTSYGLGLGADYFLTNNVALEAVLGWNGNKVKDFDATSGIGLTIGVQAFIGGGSK